MTLSKERVEFYATTEPPFGYTGGDIQAMARELLERRERDGQEPVAYMVGGYTLLHAHDPKVDDYLNRATPLYAAPPCSRGKALIPPSIPNGWKLVPIDPTKDMLRAGQSVVGFWLNTVHCYSKMLAAAPAAPQQETRTKC